MRKEREGWGGSDRKGGTREKNGGGGGVRGGRVKGGKELGRGV